MVFGANPRRGSVPPAFKGRAGKVIICSGKPGDRMLNINSACFVMVWLGRLHGREKPQNFVSGMALNGLSLWEISVPHLSTSFCVYSFCVSTCLHFTIGVTPGCILGAKQSEDSHVASLSAETASEHPHSLPPFSLPTVTQESGKSVFTD